MTFEGKVVAVTGAGGGIGTAIVSKFVDLGAKAVLLDVKEEFAKRTADLLHLTEENSMCLGVDVSKEEDVKEAVSKIRTRFNRVDVLVNTAGIPGPSARTEDYSFEDIKKVYEVNVFGTFLMMQNILPIMQEQKSGAIINFGSVSGKCFPISPKHAAPSSASISACVATSASECPTSPLSLGSGTPHSISLCPSASL